PSRTADVLLQPKHVSPVQTIMGPGVAHSGLLAPRLQGVLRSRTFVLNHNKVLYRVAGRGGRINLIIDGYQLIRDPIYGGLTLAASSGDRWEWRVQDGHLWEGHRA